MVSARFLAEIDEQLRSCVRNQEDHKLDSDSCPRPFGGLNVIFACDFWQLSPPERGGTSLANISGDLFGMKPDERLAHGVNMGSASSGTSSRRTACNALQNFGGLSVASISGLMKSLRNAATDISQATTTTLYTEIHDSSWQLGNWQS